MADGDAVWVAALKFPHLALSAGFHLPKKQSDSAEE